MTKSLLLKPWPIEIVDVAIKGFFSSSKTVGLPEGTL